MLIFFLVAGRIAPAADARLILVQAKRARAAPPPDAVLVLADGTLLQAGIAVSPADAATGVL